MHRKPHAYEINSSDKNDVDSLTKKIKCSNTLNDEEKFNSNSINVEKSEQNSTLKLSPLSNASSQQQGTTIYPNRKRRYRNSQEIYGANSTFSTMDSDSQIRKKSDLSCVVCCGVAHGYNFDAISCESCKAFFRRNALFNMDRLKCRRDGSCEITLETRRRCKSCRLKKCFAVGMRKEWILTEEEKINKKRRIEENRRLRGSVSNDLDLQSVLFNKNEKPLLKTTSSAQNSNLISNVSMAYSDGIKLDLTGYGWSYPLVRKITALCQIINTRNTTALRLISFYKRLYDFDILNEIDKVNLVKNNLQYMFFFHSSLKYDPIHDVYHEENTNDKPLYGADIREAYGVDNYIRCTKIMRDLHSIVQVDKRIMQVALVIFLFSKGLSTLINSNQLSLSNYQQIFQIQNKYVEQLWLFIEKSYGRNQSIKIFSNLIGKCLLIQDLVCVIQHDVYEKIDPCQVSPFLRSLMQPV